MIDDEGRPRPEIISAQGSRQCAIRHISSNHLVSTKAAIRLILALEDSLLRNQLPTIVATYLKNRYGSVLSSDLCTIQDTLSSLSDIDNLLHYLNWNPRALSIIQATLEPSEHDIPDDLREYSWEEAVLVDTSTRLHIVVIENDLATIVYFTQQATTRRKSRHDFVKQTKTLDKRVEHNLASVKDFHHSHLPKLSTFHLDTAKTITATDPTYLASIHSSINLIRQTYEDLDLQTRTMPKLATLQRIFDTITQIRTQLNRKLLSRQRHLKLRHYIGTIRTRIQRIIERTQDQKKNSQPRITQYFLPPQNTKLTTQDRASNSDNDQSEDYRGESD